MQWYDTVQYLHVNLGNGNARCGRDYCDAKMVMSAADAMATNGMKELGYEYIIISGKTIYYLE